MKGKIRIGPQLLEEGTKLARDVEVDGLLLLARGTRLTKKLIFQLVQKNVPYVWIWPHVQTENLEIYQKNYEHFNNLLMSAKNNIPIQLKEVDDILENFSSVRSPRELIKYVHGIRKADHYTYQHSLNVCYLSMLLGRWSNFSEITQLAQAALFHDLGKVMIDNQVLNKPGSLTEEEWEQMKCHPDFGYTILLKNSEIPKDVLKGVRHHHERMNGKGYPQGLRENEVPEIARIIAIADVFDALTSNRVYRGKRDVFEVLQYMHDCYSDFDLKYLRIFTLNMLDNLLGERVLLTDDQVGTIVFNNSLSPFKPLIQTDKDFIDLSQKSNLKIVRIL
ncbi:MAG: HD-GYP domain-containing protein [Halanaerobiales bacterium]|nr:HD-GYP domain-containing protein [Halanaerobiales bacterium]